MIFIALNKLYYLRTLQKIRIVDLKWGVHCTMYRLIIVQVEYMAVHHTVYIWRILGSLPKIKCMINEC